MRLRRLSLLFLLFLFAGLSVGQSPNADAELRARLASSVSVVVGTVGEPLRRVPFRGSGGEHQPDWWEAPVSVTSTLAGVTQKGTIQVAFSYNSDTYWEASPKLRPGEKAIFLLHRYDPKETAERVHNAFELPVIEGLLVIDRLDVQSPKNRKRIAALAKAMRSGK
jgi:hypothetical protein